MLLSASSDNTQLEAGATAVTNQETQEMDTAVETNTEVEADTRMEAETNTETEANAERARDLNDHIAVQYEEGTYAYFCIITVLACISYYNIM